MDITKRCEDINQLEQDAQVACRLFIDKCKAQGLNVKVTETYRSQDRQNWLYEQGRTRSGNIVTWTKSSVHTQRRAFDICQNIKDKEYDKAFMDNCAAIAKSIGLVWGGSFGDSPHYEVPKGWKQPVQPNQAYLQAVDKLVEHGVISSPQAWKDGTFTKNNVESLIIKFASKL